MTRNEKHLGINRIAFAPGTRKSTAFLILQTYGFRNKRFAATYHKPLKQCWRFFLSHISFPVLLEFMFLVSTSNSLTVATPYVDNQWLLESLVCMILLMVIHPSIFPFGNPLKRVALTSLSIFCTSEGRLTIVISELFVC